MKRRLIVAIAIGIALAVPAQASARTTKQETAAVTKGFTNQIRARLQLAGYKYLGDTVKCVFVGRQSWACYATYAARKGRYTFKYGIYINATPHAWKTVGSARLLREW